jgi:ABC-type branched-subunit amino acid transport system substrate-binding protein
VRRPAIALAAALLALAGCGDGGKKEGGSLLIVVNAPFSRTPQLGESIARGVELAVAEANRQGVVAGDRRYTLRVERMDGALSPARAVRNVRKAVQQGAIAIVDEGTGIDASWRIARAASVPMCIAYQGGIELVDPDTRPNVFRIAPTDRGIAFRLAEYTIPKGLKLALLVDDTDYGQEGSKALDRAFGSNPGSVAARITLPASALDVSPQVLKAKRAGATALLVWAQPATIAAAIAAARTSGWDVPVFTPPAGESPLIRQQLADHPDWVDGLTVATGRMTAELGPGFFYAFQRSYEQAFGVDRVGVKTRAGRPVIQPPEQAMYSYDFVRVLAAAIIYAASADRAKVLAALEEVTVRGANGDERGFNRRNHDGVVDDDVYFARFDDMTFRPVRDDPLSRTLPVVAQVR